MSKTLVITRGETGRYEDLFRQVGAVGRGETEDRELFMKFKYAVGKNWKKLDSERKSVESKVAEIMEPSEAYKAFIKEREEIADRFATKDEHGNVIIHRDKEGNEQREFTPENQKAGEAALAEAKERHAFAIAQYEAQEKQAHAFLAEGVTIELYSVPFVWVAERIAGAWLEAVMCMVDDEPDLERKEI